MIDLTRARYPAVILLCATALFIALAATYWHGAEKLPTCLFGSADCTLAVATYTQCFVTAAAFVAAVAAAGWAYRTYEMERAVVLAQRMCQPTCEQYARTYYIDDDFGFSELATKAEELVSIDFELLSLGRSPVVEASLDLVCTVPGKGGSKPQEYTTPVDELNLASQGSIHIRVMVSPKVINAGSLFEFRSAKRTGNGKVLRRRLELVPLKPRPVRYKIVVRLDDLTEDKSLDAQSAEAEASVSPA